MITINKPYILKKEEQSYLCSGIMDVQTGKCYTIWYSVDDRYAEYLTDEVADPFLLIMLSVGMVSHQNIRVEGAVSARLLFNIRNTLMPMLLKVLPNSQVISIEAEVSANDFSGKGVGCGCSLGVDSFASILTHLDKDVTSGYKITHLAIFNTGQFGDLNLEGAERAFHQNVELLQSFIVEVGLPLVAVNTNLNEIYKDYIDKITLVQSFPQRTISAVLALQKLFGKYVFASSYSAYHGMFLSPEDISHAESSLIPLLGTNSTEVILANSTLSRVEKTKYISNSPLVRKYLDVCWASQINNMTIGSSLMQNKKKKNCGVCDKCLRTLFTIDLLGQLDSYSEIFDVEAYKNYKYKYIIKILSNLYYS